MQMMKPDDFAAWVKRAAPGEDVVYSVGVRPAKAIGEAVRALHDQGLVSLTSKRTDSGLRFIAQRRPDPRPAQERKPVPRGRFTLGASDGKMTTRAVLRILSQAAGRDLPCPTNAELAKRVGLKDAVAASYRMRRLVADGKITVEEPSPTERRVVTIVATGKQTRRASL
ncbi:winged helix-turn-helix domain-containing protein [Sphingomonadales bacterium 58]|uniref:winged helix-turn-helix domain-containing protein n=1 Tax=Sphingobium sp. S8 TaxID=2758385 RepID=UPI00191A2C99|nr:winged helix-turn-helix domain-containing protein [Sphingobium sp. S8]MBY2957572.1 winged helix-turn-helix domain-containing protein [Sphingomonadales bacterium 58]CAD7335349.1 hypothetical protein SPHS8_00463 [Sphingobium sp. S8]